MPRAMSKHQVRRMLALAAAASLALAACGGDDDDSGSETTQDAATGNVADDADSDTDDAADADGDADDAADADGGDQDAAAANAAGGGGELVLGDETIALDSARCFLQEQDAAAGGGKILFVAQGFGVNAAGEELIVDVSRYDEDSQFAGDDVKVDIGDPFSEDFVSWSATGPAGTVNLDGSTLTADSLTFQNFDDFSEQPGSFEINC